MEDTKNFDMVLTLQSNHNMQGLAQCLAHKRLSIVLLPVIVSRWMLGVLGL